MPIFRFKSVKIYTGQKKFTRVSLVGSWQISGMAAAYNLAFTFLSGQADIKSVSREFLENMKKRQEKKVNDLLEDNKELIESIKRKVVFFQILHTRLFLFSQESCRYERCDWGSQSRVWRDDGEDGVWSNIERLSFDKVRVSSIVKVWITSAISIE